MSNIRLFTKTDKQIVLACFQANVPLRTISKKLDIPLSSIQQWYRQFQSCDRSWAKEDDKDRVLRQTALTLFGKGFGYKLVATKLNITQSRAKYWMHLYKSEQLSFFTEGRKRPKKYPLEKKLAILDRFAVSTGSKKKFCYTEGISVSTLNKWLKEKQ